MQQWVIGIVLAVGCGSREAAVEGFADDAFEALAEEEAASRGLERSEAVPSLEYGYDGEVPEDWDEAKILLDDEREETAKACLRDPYTILAQLTHAEAETIYAVSLAHPPTMTAASEGYVDEADSLRIEARNGVASYSARFGKDHDDFRARRVTIEAPASLRPCRLAIGVPLDGPVDEEEAPPGEETAGEAEAP